MLLPLSFLALFLFAITILTHYECLRLISNLIKWVDGIHRRKLLFILFGLLAAHIIEIGFYGGGYGLLRQSFELGIFIAITVCKYLTISTSLLKRIHLLALAIFTRSETCDCLPEWRH